MTRSRHTRMAFGNGSFVGDFMRDEDPSLDLEPRDLARKLGWAAGCPVVERLTDPDNNSDGRGPEPMIERYGEVSFWSGELALRLHDTNPDLFYETSAWSVLRKKGDAANMTAYDEPSIPEDHFEVMHRLGTLYGYALPRVLIEYIKNGSDDEAREHVQDRVVDGLDMFEELAADSTDIYELTASFAEAVVKKGVEPGNVAKHVLAKGWLDEHGANWMFETMENAIKQNAPSVWNAYSSK